MIIIIRIQPTNFLSTKSDLLITSPLPTIIWKSASKKIFLQKGMILITLLSKLNVEFDKEDDHM